MNYYDVSFERGEVFCANIVKAAKESDIKAHYEAEGYKCISISPISEERAMASVKYHPGKPIVEIPEVKEEFSPGQKVPYMSDMFGEQLTFAQLEDMDGELVLLEANPKPGVSANDRVVVIARVRGAYGQSCGADDFITQGIEFDCGKAEILDLEEEDFDADCCRGNPSRAWTINKEASSAPKKKTVVSVVPAVSAPGISLKALALKKDVVSSLVHIGIQTIEELKERLSEVKAKFPPDWYREISKALDIQHDIEESEKKADAVVVPDFPEPIAQQNGTEIIISSGLRDFLTADSKLDMSLRSADNILAGCCIVLSEIFKHKLWRNSCFSSFDEYCRSKTFLGRPISGEQGRKMAHVGELLEQNSKSTWNFEFTLEELGIEKAFQLYKASPEKRMELLENQERLKDATVKELAAEVKADNARIKELESRHKQELEAEKAKTEALKRDKENAYSELSKTEQRLAESRAREERLRNENTEKDLQIQELESRPIEHEYVKSDEELKRIQELERENGELEEQNKMVANLNDDLSEENRKLADENRRLTQELQEAVQKSGTEREVLERYRSLIQRMKELQTEVMAIKENNAWLPGAPYDELHRIFLSLDDTEALINSKLKNRK